MPWCRVSGCEFSNKKWYSGSNPYGHGSSCHPWQHPPVVNLLFAPPCLSALFKKISTPSDRHRGMTFRPPWAFCVLGLCRKNVLWDTKFAANNVQKGEYGSIGKKLAPRYSFWRNWVSGRRIFRYRPILFSFCFLPVSKSTYRVIYLL